MAVGFGDKNEDISVDKICAFVDKWKTRIKLYPNSLFYPLNGQSESLVCG